MMERPETQAGPRQEAAVRDRALLQRIGAGDAQAFEELYHAYYPYLFRFIYRVTHRLDGIEELINDVMLVVWQKAAGLELRCAPATWILSIAYNKSLKLLKYFRDAGDAVTLDEVGDALPCGDPGMIERLEFANLLLVALQALSPDQRAVMELAYYHGLHYSDIAVVMDCPEATVKTRIYYARQKLRAVMPQLLGEV